MAPDLIRYWMDIAVHVAVVFVIATVGLLVCCVFINMVLAWCQSPRMRLFTLGGVSTLREKLNDPCTLCGESMEAGEKVRTLSCDHVFHCGDSVKCANDIDQVLRRPSPLPWMTCPICHKYLHRVLPWKRPPPSLPAPSSVPAPPTSMPGWEEGLLLPRTLPERSASQGPVGRFGSSVLGEVLQGFFRRFCLCILGTDRG